MKKTIQIIVLLLCGFIYYSCKEDIVDPFIPPPVAKMDASATSGEAPLTVTFTDISTGKITSREWKFEDGSIESNASVSRTYNKSGNYSVQLKVIGPGGSNSTTQNVSIIETVKPPSPPQGVSASQNSFDLIRVSWNAASNADGYKIYRALISGSSTGELVATTSSTSWTDLSVTKAKSYYYFIKAYNKGGESTSSTTVLGYRLGWRFENVNYYNPSDGIGFSFNLYAYGFYNSPKAVAIYAIYYKNGVYYYVPGSGWKNVVIYKTSFSPGTNTYVFSNWKIWLYDNTWNGDYRNAKYPQYIAMKVYKSSNPSDLNDPTYEETIYYRIYWSGTVGKPQLRIGEQLAPEESARIREQLQIEK